MTSKNKVSSIEIGDKVFLRIPQSVKTAVDNLKYSSSQELILLKKVVIGGYFDDDYTIKATEKDEKSGNVFEVNLSNLSHNPNDFPYGSFVIKGVILVISIALSFYALKDFIG